MVDTRFTLRLVASKQPVYTESLDAITPICIIDIQYGVYMYYCLHPGDLLHFMFWSTAIHTISVRDDLVPSHFCTFGRQYTACWFIHLFVVNIAWYTHHLVSISFSLISMLYVTARLNVMCPGTCNHSFMLLALHEPLISSDTLTTHLDLESHESTFATRPTTSPYLSLCSIAQA